MSANFDPHLVKFKPVFPLLNVLGPNDCDGEANLSADGLELWKTPPILLSQANDDIDGFVQDCRNSSTGVTAVLH